jgi:hypothetical protein
VPIADPQLPFVDFHVPIGDFQPPDGGFLWLPMKPDPVFEKLKTSFIFISASKESNKSPGTIFIVQLH